MDFGELQILPIIITIAFSTLVLLALIVLSRGRR